MRILFNIFLLVILFFVSCKGRTDKNVDDLPETKSSGVDTIHIDFDTIPENVGFGDLFSKIEVIPLQTNKKSTIRYCQKVIVNEENISKYVALDAMGIELFSFDSTGNFIQKSSLNITKSVSEFPHPWLLASGDRFIYNPFDSLYMYYSNDKFSMYNNETLKNTGKEKVNLDSTLYLSAFFPLNKDVYVFRGILSDRTPEECSDIICFYSKSGDSIIKKQTILQNFYSAQRENSSFSTFNSRYFFQSQIVSDTIYEIHPDSLSVVPFLIVDYGERNLADYINRLSDGKSKGYAYLLNMLQNNQSYWFFSRFEGIIYISIYNKTTQKMQTVPAGNIVYNTPLLTDEILYCLVYASRIQEVINSGILTEENANRLAKVKPEDNPVILKCYLK